MYTAFFGFRCKPFQLSPDPEFLFLSGVHKRALTYLRYGIEENFGFILVTGEIGTGKTTLIRSMIRQLPRDIKLARLHNTKVSSHQLISMINEEFGLDAKNKDKSELLRELTDFLIQQYAEGARAAIIIDEAQNLSVDLLEEIRLLSNLETDKAKLLQIILVGQPELNEKLGRPGLEQLRQRIAVSTHISPLNREDAEAYIRHRLGVAGNEHALTFEEGVMDEIYAFSGGIPRLINILAEFTLLAAFIDSKKSIDLELIKEIINDLRNERSLMTAAKEIKRGPAQQDSSARFKKVFSSFHLRLQNLEAALQHMQRGAPAVMPREGLEDTQPDEELKKREEAVFKKECELREREEFLRKRENDVRYLIEQTTAGSPLKKDAGLIREADGKGSTASPERRREITRVLSKSGEM